MASFKCDFCEKVFSQKNNLSRHVRNIHERVSSKCSKCKKIFTRDHLMRQHEAVCGSNQVSNSQGGVCDVCGKFFKRVCDLNRHKHSVHAGIKFACVQCNKKYSRNSDRIRHEQTCQPITNTYVCANCSAKFSTLRELEKHALVHQRKRDATAAAPGPSAKRPRADYVQCRRCTDRFQNRRELHAHNMAVHFQVGDGGLQAAPWGTNSPPWLREDGEIDEALEACYATNRPLILAPHEPRPVKSVFNVPVSPDMTITDIGRGLLEIYQRQTHAFRVNITFGMILRHIETGELRYFRPFSNQAIFDAPCFIAKRSDLAEIIQKLKDMDIMHQLLKNRPDTKWRLEIITNMRFEVFCTNYVLGVSRTPLPSHVTYSHSIISLEKDTHDLVYRDNLCAFRCMSLHKYNDLTHTSELFVQWKEYLFSNCDEDIREVSLKDFKGVQLTQLTHFESCFRTNIHVYNLVESGIAIPVFRSTERYDNTVFLNKFKHHLSYITNFEQYAVQYHCPTCKRIFGRADHLSKHGKVCDNKTKFVYPGGFLQRNMSIFEQLEVVGIKVQPEDRYFPYFAVFDFESVLEKMPDSTGKLQFTHQHVPVSVSVCSNLPDHDQAQCIIHRDLDSLLESMIQSLNSMQRKCAELAEEKWGWVLAELMTMMSVTNDNINTGANADDNDDDNDDDDDDAVDESEPEVFSLKRLASLHEKVSAYMHCLPVFGFNSAKYDLPLVKSKLAKHLRMHEQKHGFTVKKASSYACIQSDHFRFMDASHFLAPGTSYAKFLKAYQVEECKGFFPYSYFDSFDKLKETSLPPQEAFYNDLKNEGITDDDYAYCQRVWSDENMSTFRDFLVWYNNLDVAPFVLAIQRLQKFYFDKGIDVFKTAISVPGIARQMLYKTAEEAGAEFSLIDQGNEELHQTIKQNIVGGPSIIFTRHAKADETLIRGGKTCKKVVGYDANALYLGAIGQEMPEGSFVIRKSENEFRPQIRDPHMQAFNWLNYVNRYHNKRIKHKRNSGAETIFGKYPVDGFDESENTIYQFHGCYYHGHECHLTAKIKNVNWWKNRESVAQRTQKTTDWLRSKNFTVIEMRECDFQEFCKDNDKITEIAYQSRPSFCQKHRGKVTEAQIVKGVRDNSLFGMVEVDISVPEQWGSDFQSELSPQEYFGEMCPIFCNTDVPMNVIGSHMQEHVKELGLSDKPRRLLVGGTKARQILVATPLLQWYLEHGMVVSKIYQVIEYRRQKCFESFVQEVSDARRAGDTIPEKAIIADTMKLIGNSGYGSLIMDKTRHRNIKYVSGEDEACYEVNIPQFRSMSCLDLEDGYYEIESSKKRIKLDLPIQLGYFILQYAKLRMLEFYYDFVDKFVDRSDYEYLEMDTDSAYMSLSAASLSEIVKPELKQEYERGLSGLCDDAYNSPTNRWLPRTCCTDHSTFDRRVPGLFKTEYVADEMIGLCSKTYLARSGDSVKFSSKGISKRYVQNPLDTFRSVIFTRQPSSGMNMGFRARDNGVCTYRQERTGFSYFYCKRRVLDDGIHTAPLDIVLCPCPSGPDSDAPIPEAELLDILNSLQ